MEFQNNTNIQNGEHNDEGLIINLSAKNIKLEQENSNATDYPQTSQNLGEDFIVEEEESDEEFFEDALDEVIAQNVLDCLNQTDSSSQYESTSEVSSDDNDPIAESNTSTPSSSNLPDENNRQNMVQILLERQRNELALELRRLQYSNRPQEARNQLEEIFNSSINQPQIPTRNESNASQINQQQRLQPNPEIYRSENVRSEISQLNSRQMVSNIQSSFRESIERILLQHAPTNNNSDTRARPNQRQLLLGQIQQSRTERESQLQRASTNSDSDTRARPNQRQLLLDQIQQIRVERDNQTPSNTRPVIRPTLPYLVTRSNNNPLHDNYRENIISEISDLVHRELVSNTLQSNFRSRLESTIRDRIRASGINNNQTRQNIRQLLADSRVTSSVQRNDFSHLGIDSANNNLNDESLESASQLSEQQQHRQRTTIIHHNNAREIRDLKTELQEMKNLLKLSFDMQMDMQRSFKQEISALVSGTFHDTASVKVVNSTISNREGKCIICTECDCDTVLYQCGHMVSCYMCSLNLKNKGHNCPVCRAPIKDIVRTFKSSLE